MSTVTSISETILSKIHCGSQMINTACVEIKHQVWELYLNQIEVEEKIWYHVDNEMWYQVDDQGVDQVWWTLYEYGNNVFE